MKEHLAVIINKTVSYAAMTGAGVGGANAVINSTHIQDTLSIAEWGGIVGIAGGIVLIIERLYNIYTKWHDRKKDIRIDK